MTKDALLPCQPAILACAAALAHPAFLIHRPTVVGRLFTIRDAWEAYGFPVKAQPHPDILAAAAELGTDFDVCGDEEIDAVLSVGIPGHRITWTSPWADAALFDRLAGLGAKVYLDSPDQVALWCARHPARGVGLRLCAGTDVYGEKFGLALEDVPHAIACLGAARCPLTGLHAHAAVLGPDDPAQLCAPVLEALKVAVDALADSPRALRISLGGGWPVRPLSEDPPFRGCALNAAARARLVAPLAKRGCAVTLAIEVGEHVLAPTGVYAARVAAVHERAERRVVVLAAPWVVAPRYADYPVTFFCDLSGDPRVVKSGCRPTTVYGASNSPADTVARNAMLPCPDIGDLALVGHCGAYLASLVAPFNGRPPPPTHVVD